MISVSRILLYYAFAFVAIGINVVVQRLFFLGLNHPNAILFAMPIGAGVALLVKYFLDRKYIFEVASSPNQREFFRYAISGGLITLIFFVVEYLIWSLYETALARDLGIFVGMMTGYALKYFFDRNFVFVAESERVGYLK